MLTACSTSLADCMASRFATRASNSSARRSKYVYEKVHDGGVVIDNKDTHIGCRDCIERHLILSEGALSLRACFPTVFSRHLTCREPYVSNPALQCRYRDQTVAGSLSGSQT